MFVLLPPKPNYVHSTKEVTDLILMKFSVMKFKFGRENPTKSKTVIGSFSRLLTHSRKLFCSIY